MANYDLYTWLDETLGKLMNVAVSRGDSHTLLGMELKFWNEVSFIL